MLRKALGWWSVNDNLPDKIDVIVVISYAATKTKLTLSSSEVALKALSMAKMHPESTVYWGTFGKGQFESTERRLKDRLFRGLKHVYVGSVTSTTDEHEAVQKRLPGGTQNIVVLMEGSHSRRCMTVWKYFHENDNVYGWSTNPIDTKDPDNPMWTQCHWAIWLPVNTILLPLYWGDGPRRMARLNLSQPTW